MQPSDSRRTCLHSRARAQRSACSARAGRDRPGRRRAADRRQEMITIASSILSGMRALS